MSDGITERSSGWKALVRWYAKGYTSRGIYLGTFDTEEEAAKAVANFRAVKSQFSTPEQVADWVDVPSRMKVNTIRLLRSHAEIDLLTGGTTKIDLGDVALVRLAAWYLTNNGRVIGNLRFERLVVSLSRHLLGCIRNDGLCVDHINRDPLDNRRVNLRVVTRAENNQNIGNSARLGSVKYRGTYKVRRSGRFRARCKVDGKVYEHKASFSTEDEAAVAAYRLRRKHMTHENGHVPVLLGGKLWFIDPDRIRAKLSRHLIP